MKLDVGCGTKLEEDFVGLDQRPFPGVEHVFDLNGGDPWPFADDTFEYIRAKHIIEHIDDTIRFFAEVHRVCSDGAILHIETPHYSNRDSWLDPTHVRHFSYFFADPIVSGNLLEVDGGFEFVNKHLSLGTLARSWPARTYIAIYGIDRYERYRAWRWPARNVKLDIRIVKPAP
jgi:SAM-dependent methyltransferase